MYNSYSSNELKLFVAFNKTMLIKGHYQSCDASKLSSFFIFLLETALSGMEFLTNILYCLTKIIKIS